MDPRIRHFHKNWYRVPFLVPAWGTEEIRAALLGDFERFADDPRIQLKRELSQPLGFEHVVLTSTGRFALEVGLRALVGPGEVIIPTMVCASVARAVIRAGCVPVPVDINPDLTLSCDSVKASLTDGTVAVVVAHVSGMPAQDLERLVELCARRNIALIDDAAQALGISWKGRPLGSHGRFGVLSFGLGKPTFSIGGGALVVHSSADTDRCEVVLRQLAQESSARLRRNTAALFVLEYCWRRYTLPAFMAQRALRRALRCRPAPSPRGEIDPLSAALQVMQIRRLDQILARFRANAEIVIDRLAERSDITFPQSGNGSGYTKLILSLERGDVRELARRLLMRGVEIEWSYATLDRHQELSAYCRSENPTAAATWRRLLTLPNHPRLSASDASYVAAATAESLDRMSR